MTNKATAKGPKLVDDGSISNAEFVCRLIRAVRAYEEYCQVVDVHQSSCRPVDWLDHFFEFLDVQEIEKAKNSS